MSNETKIKLSMSLKGRKSWNKGIAMREETKEKLSKIRKGKPSPRKGVKLSIETRKKISESKKGIKPSENCRIKMINNNHKAKKVYCIETNKIYSSARQCALDMGLERSSITRVCNKQLKQTKKYHFEWYDKNKTEIKVSNAILGCQGGKRNER